jgi:hypothetical protein
MKSHHKIFTLPFGNQKYAVKKLKYCLFGLQLNLVAGNYIFATKFSCKYMTSHYF